MTINLRSVPDAERIDVARARHWWVTVRGSSVVVVATCREEARLLGLLWVAIAKGRDTVELGRLGAAATAREADESDVERWLALRAQQDALDAQLKRGRS